MHVITQFQKGLKYDFCSRIINTENAFCKIAKWHFDQPCFSYIVRLWQIQSIDQSPITRLDTVWQNSSADITNLRVYCCLIVRNCSANNGRDEFSVQPNIFLWAHPIQCPVLPAKLYAIKWHSKYRDPLDDVEMARSAQPFACSICHYKLQREFLTWVHKLELILDCKVGRLVAFLCVLTTDEV